MEKIHSTCGARGGVAVSHGLFSFNCMIRKLENMLYLKVIIAIKRDNVVSFVHFFCSLSLKDILSVRVS